MKNIEVPKALKSWFVIHFVADISFAIPLMIAPVYFLKLAGWNDVDPFSTRLVAAALFGIGTESVLCRNAPITTFKNMLDMKIIWSLFAVVGLGISLIQNAQGRPFFGWAALVIFILFNFLWTYWRIRVVKILSGK